MKKLYTLLAGIALTASSYAQLAYYTGNDLIVPTDSATAVLEAGEEKFGYIYVTNESADSTIDLTWRRIGYNYDEANWSIQFCECANCYTNAFAPLPSQPPLACNPMTPGQVVEWKVGIDIGNDAGTAINSHMIIQVEDLTFGGYDTLYFVTDGTVGTEELFVNERDIQMFPQPANDVVNVLIPHVLNGTCEITITNVLGQNVTTQTVQTEVLTTVDVSDLNKGIYIMSIRQNGKVVGTKRMVISE